MSGELSTVYTDYLVVFMDILGMADKIKQSEDNDELAEEILNIFKHVKTIADDINEHQWEGLQVKKINVHRFSDTIAISIPEITINALILLVNIVGAIEFGLIEKSLFIRGAIVVGKHYEGEADIFLAPPTLEHMSLRSWHAGREY
jgi:hypothetical protein